MFGVVALFDPGAAYVGQARQQVEDVVEEENLDDQVTIPFTKVDLTFANIRYTVTASTSKDKLQLLKGVDGVVYAGQMTALMGSSG